MSNDIVLTMMKNNVMLYILTTTKATALSNIELNFEFDDAK